MGAAPITIKLRCKSWAQLKAIYQRDLSRGAVFLRTSKPPPLGTPVRIDLSLPSDSLIVLKGEVTAHVPDGGLGGRGPGIDIGLGTVPQSALWLIESALKSAAASAAPKPSPRAEPVAAPAMEDGADVASAEGELVGALREEYESLRKLNPFQVLGVPYDTTDAAVRAAFGELTRKYHPDRFARYQSQEARQYSSEIFILIRDAYRKLGTDKARTRTVQILENRRKGTPTRGTAPASPSQSTAVPHTVRDLKSGPAQGPAFTARPEPRPAPKSGDALGEDLFGADAGPPASAGTGASAVEVGGGWRSKAPPTYSDAERHLDAGEFDQALAIFGRAARQNPGDRLARAGVELAEGLKALAQRDRLEAAQRFEAVLELDPANERAARELAEMRRVATNERKGLLSRLLGKKE